MSGLLCRAWSGPKLFDTWMVFLEEFREKIEKISSDDKKKMWKINQHAKSFF